MLLMALTKSPKTRMISFLFKTPQPVTSHFKIKQKILTYDNWTLGEILA